MKKVKLTKEQFLNGSEYKAGTELELPNAVADFLVERKLATEVKTEPTKTESPAPKK